MVDKNEYAFFITQPSKTFNREYYFTRGDVLPPGGPPPTEGPEALRLLEVACVGGPFRRWCCHLSAGLAEQGHPLALTR